MINNRTAIPSNTQSTGDQATIRNENITVAKGIGIILVVISHSGLPLPLNQFIFVFHVPLFFIVAGYCFKTAYCNAPLKFARRRAKGLWWPFVKWNLIFILLHNALYAMGIIDNAYDTHGHLTAIAETLLMIKPEPMLAGLWFLAGLFFASLISWIVLWATGCNIKKVSAWAAVMMICVILLNLFLSDNRIVMRLSGFIHFAIYFLTGFVLKGIHNRYKSTRKRLIATSILCLILTGTASVYFPGAIFTLFTWQVPLRFVGSVAGVIGVLILSSHIPHGRLRRFIVFCGESTILILVWHFLAFKLFTYILINAYGLPHENLLETPIHMGLARYYWVAYAAVGLLIPLGIQVAYNFLKNKILHLGKKTNFVPWGSSWQS